MNETCSPLEGPVRELQESVSHVLGASKSVHMAVIALVGDEPEVKTQEVSEEVPEEVPLNVSGAILQAVAVLHRHANSIVSDLDRL